METAILVVEAAILGILIGGGWWLHHVVSQQRRLKDDVIQTLRAENERLEALKAPTIIEEHKSMKDYAESVTQEKMKLFTKLSESQAETDRIVKGLNVQLEKAKAGIAEGNRDWIAVTFLEGAAQIRKALEQFFASAEAEASVPEALKVLLLEVHNNLVEEGTGLFKGREPSFETVRHYRKQLKQ